VQCPPQAPWVTTSRRGTFPPVHPILAVGKSGWGRMGRAGAHCAPYASPPPPPAPSPSAEGLRFTTPPPLGAPLLSQPPYPCTRSKPPGISANPVVGSPPYIAPEKWLKVRQSRSWALKYCRLGHFELSP
jgi:hypothetical protein